MRKILRVYGFCEIYEDDDHFSIQYGGNMGNTEDDVEECVDHIYGTGVFKKLKKTGEYYRDKHNIYNSPAYLYILKVPKAEFKSITGK